MFSFTVDFFLYSMYIHLLDLLLIILFTISVWFVISISVFRKKFLSFLLCLAVASSWGFYASFDIFIFFLIMSEFLIIILLLIGCLSYNFVSLQTKLPGIFFFFILAALLLVQSLVSKERTIFFLYQYHAVYNYFLECVSSSENRTILDPP